MGKGILNYDDEESPICKKAKKSDETKPVASSSSEDENKNYGITFKELGGVDDVVKELEMGLSIFLHTPTVFGIAAKPTRGVLLVGPTGRRGCGKTAVAHAFGNEVGLAFYGVSALELTTCDHIEVIAGNFKLDIEKSLLNELVRCMDNPRNNEVMVIAATDIPQILDPVIKRRRRFEREIYIGLPDETAKLKMLEVVLRGIKVEDNIDLIAISKMTRGFCANDLKGLIDQAGRIVMRRICEKRKVIHEDWLTKPFSDEELKSDLITN
ncbi:hypothetical protein LXL04_022583 [Taraxacum kok-saghyz]